MAPRLQLLVLLAALLISDLVAAANVDGSLLSLLLHRIASEELQLLKRFYPAGASRSFDDAEVRDPPSRSFLSRSSIWAAFVRQRKGR